MNLTSSEIEQDFYLMLKGSGLETDISGSIYKSGMRHLDSKNEDVVITFLAGISEQMQSGVIVINIYVPNITDANLKDTERCLVLENEIKTWISQLSTLKYKISLNSTIQVFEEAEINQHFISTKLNFKLFIQ